MGGVESSADIFRAVADPTRRALLGMLQGSERSVQELQHPFRMTQPAISQHLRILRKARLVRSRREGRACVYRLNPKPLAVMYRWAAQFVQVTDPSGHVWRLAGRMDE